MIIYLFETHNRIYKNSGRFIKITVIIAILFNLDTEPEILMLMASSLDFQKNSLEVEETPKTFLKSLP